MRSSPPLLSRRQSTLLSPISPTVQLVVLRVGANPKPEQAVRSLYSERSVMETNSSGPETPDLLEVKARMLRISLEELERLVRKFSNAGW